MLLGLLSLLIALTATAEKYGPTQASDSLWKIAKKTPHDDSISTRQLAYAIYKLNPRAFNSANMNTLKKGVYLKLPTNIDASTLTSNNNIDQEYRAHLQKLEQSQTAAKKLVKAKTKYKKWHKAYLKTRKALDSSILLTDEKKRILTQQLKTATTKQKRWKRKVRKLRRLILKSSQNKTIAPTKTSTKAKKNKSASKVAPRSKVLEAKVQTLNNENTDLKSRIHLLEEKTDKILVTQQKETSNREQQILQLQKELSDSKQYLQENQQAQSKMEDHLITLEEELGDKEQIILKLQSTLRTAAETMKQQQLENNNLQKRLTELDTSIMQTTSQKRLEIMPQVQSQKSDNNNASTVTLDLTDTTTETSNIVRLLVTLTILSILLSFLFLLLKKTNRQREFRKRMEVVELKLRPSSNKKSANNPFKKSA